MADEVVEAPAPIRFPKRRGLKVDAAAVVDSVLQRVEAIRQDMDRTDWMNARLQRYAKYRGWLQEKTWPWAGAANVHPPLLQAAELRQNAGLANVLTTQRPLVSAQETQEVNKERAQTITDLLDTQLFLDPGPGRAERRMADYVSAFLQDGNAVAYTPWVRDERTVTRMVYLPPIAGDHDAAVQDWIDRTYPDTETVVLVDQVENRFILEATPPDGGPSHQITITAYSTARDGLELEITEPTVQFDGPVMLPLAISSVYVPTRTDNLQPPSPANPSGAPYVAVEWSYPLDWIRRAKRDGTLNQLDADGLKAIEAWAKGQAGSPKNDHPDRDALETQKDEMEGRTHESPPDTDDANLGIQNIPCFLVFDQWALTEDGDLEDVVWVVQEETRVLLDARRLTERWPATRPYRPFGEAVCLPVPGRYYGISLLELGEHLYDMIKGTLDQSYDANSIASLPFFFYSATAKLPADRMRLGPGEGFPVPGDPKAAVYFPAIPQRDQSTALQFVGLFTQYLEKTMQIGDLQFGRVPTGKASALRTVGTTQALLQQGDVRADQMLLRLFEGIRQIALNFHRMNRHLLPPQKEIRRLGWAGEAGQAYGHVRVEDIDADTDFEFRPDFMLSNKANQAAALQEIMQVLVSPLAMQMGAVGKEQFRRLIQDFVRAKSQDPRRYVAPPGPDATAPAILATEAINMLIAGQRPEGPPLEGLEAHLKTMTEFFNSDAFAALAPHGLLLFKEYMASLVQQQQQQSMLQAAGQFQQSMMQGGGGMPVAGMPPAMGDGVTGQPQPLEGTGVGA
jgi:hypothetical protein